MSPPRRYEITSRAERDLARLDVQMRRRILDAFDGLVADPPRGDVRKVMDSVDEWRLRVGDWRVRFTRDDATGIVSVLRVLPRGRAYRD